jgi:chemotaxis protein histidine kinase CheA
LAAMLAGSIGMESELDKGSTFWLDIPVTLTKEA